MDYRVVFVVGLFVVGLFQCFALRIPAYSPVLVTIAMCASFATPFVVLWIQKKRIAAAAEEAKRATHLEVLRYAYCLAFVITSCIDEVRVVKKPHGGQGFTYCPLTLVAALIGNLAVELLGEWLGF